MIDCLTDKSKNVLVFAQDEAMRLQRQVVGSAQILIGLTKVDGIANEALKERDVTAERIKQVVENRVHHPDSLPSMLLRLSPRALSILDRARHIAKERNLTHACTEHILLALLHESDSQAYLILRNLEVSPIEISDSIARLEKQHANVPAEIRETRLRELYHHKESIENAKKLLAEMASLRPEVLKQLNINPKEMDRELESVDRQLKELEAE